MFLGYNFYIMKKYLAWFALVFLISVVVNAKHEEYANNSAADSGNQDFSVFLYDTPKSKDYSPDPHDKAAVWWERGYIFFGWPTGTTIWALVITFAVIAEQTMATRKAAENADNALAFQQETLRPRVKINQFVNDVLHEAVVAQDWVIVNMKISNSGGLPAYGVIADTWIEFVWGTPPYKFSSDAKYARADLRLNVHTGDPTGFELPLGRKLTDQERYAMGHGEGTVCFRVKLTYQALAREVHTDEAWSVGLGGMRSIAEYSSET